MRVPYSYLIGWPELDKWYYGLRYAIDCHPTDFWVTYFTSSKHVKKFVVDHGEPTVRQIRKVWLNGDVQAARDWEHRVLRRLSVATNIRWINKTHNKSRPPLYGCDNPATKAEVKQKISKSITMMAQEMGDSFYPRTQKFKDLMASENGPSKRSEVRQKKREKMLAWGENNPAKDPEFREWLSELHAGEKNPFYGLKHTEETRRHISEMTLGKPKKKVQCAHCGKIGGVNAMTRWHFDNCRHQKT